MKKVAFYTLGCKVNQNDTEAIAGLFTKAGYQVVDFNELADVYIINTCTVTHLADRKSRQIIRRAVNTNPQAIIGVIGCMAQVNPEEVLKIPGVRLVVGTHQREQIVQMVETAQKATEPLNFVQEIKETTFESIPLEKRGSRTRAFLKIQEGCNQYCAYCIVPYARGPLRSRPLADVVAEAKRAAENGYRELVLTGIHLGAYGADFQQQINLATVIRKLLTIDGLRRIRLSSIDPTEVTDELIELVSDSPRLCNHLHIPLQSGDDTILKRMRRHYTTGEYAALITKIKKRIPDVAITTDLIVGFPGETDDYFANTIKFVEQISFARIHVFKYSPRQGTLAATFPDQVPYHLKELRSKTLLDLAAKQALMFNQNFCGKTVNVLIEQPVATNKWEGLTDNYIRTIVNSTFVKRGSIVPVKVNAAFADYVTGELV